ncbi:FAD-binding domain-containing protein [Thozetella sp. PMI_491]|nr:FAD-binding domain-containing protein [Thozetella sp. PMI_491]
MHTLSLVAAGAWAALVATAAAASSPGEAACANLTAMLPSKVANSILDLRYIGSQLQYYNAKQSAYYPSCVVYPTSTQDVSTALKAIKAAGSRFAVKTAGHNPNQFFSSVDKGVLIDLNQMNNRTYDAATTLGTYEPGGKFGDIYDYFAQFNRTVVGARLAGVGTGLALGGGLSYLSSQYGMACDGFRELEVVTPNGDIVTASPDENEDLFFACRGGGGNAYGIVTKYTVQTRPIGSFYAGNIFYFANQTKAVMAAVTNFTLHNTDPKAAIIGTWEKFFLPTVFDLDALALLFLVYDGEDPGDAFANFTSLPNLANTLGTKTYKDVVNMPIANEAELSRGDNIFRVAVHDFSDDTYLQAFDAWETWCDENKGDYVLSSLDFQPIPRSLTDASKAQNGGNAMQMPDGPWFWINFLITTPPLISDCKYNEIQASFREMVNSVPNAPGLPLFINDANYDQNPLRTFSTFGQLQQIKAKYDPDNFFTDYTGGWSFA